MVEMCRFPWWPMAPVFGAGVVLVALLAIAGVIFSVVMLVDCLKRPAAKFYNPFTKEAEYDRLIWAVVIAASFWFYFLGAIIYFFVVKRAKPEDRKESQLKSKKKKVKSEKKGEGKG